MPAKYNVLEKHVNPFLRSWAKSFSSKTQSVGRKDSSRAYYKLRTRKYLLLMTTRDVIDFENGVRACLGEAGDTRMGGRMTLEVGMMTRW